MEDEHGVPTAPLVTARFADFVERDARARGNFLRFGHPPYPVVGMSRDVLRQYIEGPDPITSKPLMQEILDALTVPLTEREKHPTIVRKPRRPRLLAADTDENLYRTFVENGWTDGLPIVLPTEERVAEMLTGTDHAPDEIVGRMIITTHQEKMEYTRREGRRNCRHGRSATGTFSGDPRACRLAGTVDAQLHHLVGPHDGGERADS